jgi:hypothetical protein
VFQISNETVEREPLMQQSLQRFPALTLGAVHAPSGIIAAANEGMLVAVTISLAAKSQSPVMFAKRASACVGMCFTNLSGRLAVAHQDGFIYIYKVDTFILSSQHVFVLLTHTHKVEVGSKNLHPRVCCVCAHDAPLIALCHVPKTDDLAAADESGSCVCVYARVRAPHLRCLCVLECFFKSGDIHVSNDHRQACWWPQINVTFILQVVYAVGQLRLWMRLRKTDRKTVFVYCLMLKSSQEQERCKKYVKLRSISQ